MVLLLSPADHRLTVEGVDEEEEGSGVGILCADCWLAEGERTAPDLLFLGRVTAGLVSIMEAETAAPPVPDSGVVLQRMYASFSSDVIWSKIKGS